MKNTLQEMFPEKLITIEATIDRKILINVDNYKFIFTLDMRDSFDRFFYPQLVDSYTWNSKFIINYIKEFFDSSNCIVKDENKSH